MSNGFYGNTNFISVNGWNFNEDEIQPNLTVLIGKILKGELDLANIKTILIDYELDFASSDFNDAFNVEINSETNYKKNYDYDKAFDQHYSKDLLTSGTKYTINTSQSVLLSQSFNRLSTTTNNHDKNNITYSTDVGYKNGFHQTVWEILNVNFTETEGEEQKISSFSLYLIGSTHEEWPQISIEMYSPEYSEQVRKNGNSFPRINSKNSTISNLAIAMAPNWSIAEDVDLNLPGIDPKGIWDPSGKNTENKVAFTKYRTNGNYLDLSEKSEFNNFDTNYDTYDTKQLTLTLNGLGGSIGTLFNHFYGTKDRKTNLIKFQDKSIVETVGNRRDKEYTTLWGNLGNPTDWDALYDSYASDNEDGTNLIPLTIWGQFGHSAHNMPGQQYVPKYTDTENKELVWNTSNLDVNQPDLGQNHPTIWGQFNYMKKTLKPLIDKAGIMTDDWFAKINSLIESTKNEKTVVEIIVENGKVKLPGDLTVEYDSGIGYKIGDSSGFGIYNNIPTNAQGLPLFSSIELSIPTSNSIEANNFIINNNFNIVYDSETGVTSLKCKEKILSTDPNFKLHVEITH